MAIADLYDGFLIDLDGVVWLGGDLIEGADHTIRTLIESGKRVAFVTNSPQLSPAERARQLGEHGIGIEESSVITAGAVLIDLTRDRVGEGSPIFAIGTDSFLRQIAAAGFDPVGPDRWQQARAVLVSAHDKFSYRELRAAAMAARAGVFLAATARDPTMPMPDGLWPGTGAILAAVETASGCRAEIAGKPGPPIFRAGINALDLPPGAPVAMVGDRIDTDVGGAQRTGIDGILVAGNVSSGGTDGEEIKPDHRIDSLTGLLG